MRVLSAFLAAFLAAGCAAGGAAPTNAPLPTLAPTAAAAASAVNPPPTAAPSPAPSTVPSATPSPTPRATVRPSPVPSTRVAATSKPTRAPTPAATIDPNATAAPTPIDLRPMLTSELTVVNLGAAPMLLTVTILDPDSTDEYPIGTFELQPLQVTAQAILAARFRLAFDYPGGKVADGGTCVIDIAEGEHVQFAVLERGGVLTAGPEPDDPKELVIATASRCRAGKTS
jgi:hypothetical protein